MSDEAFFADFGQTQTSQPLKEKKRLSKPI